MTAAVSAASTPVTVPATPSNNNNNINTNSAEIITSVAPLITAANAATIVGREHNHRPSRLGSHAILVDIGQIFSTVHFTTTNYYCQQQ